MTNKVEKTESKKKRAKLTLTGEAKLNRKVLDSTGKETADINLSEAVFGKSVSIHNLYQVVRWQRAGWRAGNHSVQTRAEMSGGGAKPWKQKGTGRARAGSNTSPLWVGGGIAHGPKVRSYEFKLNKKVRRSAICGALSVRNAEDKVLFVNSFNLSTIKTKEAAKVLLNLGLQVGAKTLVVLSKDDSTTAKSLRNIERVKVTTVEALNVYDILNTEYVILAGDTASAVESRLTIN